MQKSKPFTFGFDDDDIDGKEIEGLSQGIEQSPTQSELPGIVAPQLHSLYNLVGALKLWFSTMILRSLTHSAISLTSPPISHALIHVLLPPRPPSIVPYPRVTCYLFLSTCNRSRLSLMIHPVQVRSGLTDHQSS